MKQLIKFCHENGIYPQVHYYTHTRTICSPRTFAKIMTGKTDCVTFFSDGFAWTQTKEGYHFWSTIHSKWWEFCHKNKKNI